MGKQHYKDKDGRIYYPLTPSQAGLHEGEQMASFGKKDVEYNVLTIIFSVAAPVNLSALNQAYNSMIHQNDALRIRIVRRKFRLCQYIADFQEETLPVVNCVDRAGFQRYYDELLQKDRIPFLNESLVHAFIADFDEGAALVLRIRHDCIDGYSLTLLLKQLKEFYTAFAAGKPEPVLTTGSITEYFMEQEKYVHSQTHKEDVQYFRNLFLHQRDYSFPAGHPARNDTSTTITRTISGQTYQGLYAISQTEGISMQLILLCAIALTTLQLTGESNFSIAVFTHGRRSFRRKKQVGCMMNSLPLFFDIDQSQSLLAFLKQSNVNYLNMLIHGQVILTDYYSATYKEAFRNSMNFNTMWMMFSPMDYEDVVKDEKFSSDVYGSPHQTAQFYCGVFDQSGTEVTFELSYQDQKFSSDEVNQMCCVFLDLCEKIAADPGQTISSVIFSSSHT